MMLSFNAIFSLLLMASLGCTQMTPMCAQSSSSSTTPCLLTYYRFMAQQTPPTSTVYQTIVTTIFNIVDCHQCSVTNVNANAVKPIGFTGPVTTVPTLTITEVGCMPETTAITRREVRGEKRQSQIRSHKRAFFVQAVRPYRHRSLKYRQTNATTSSTTTEFSPTALVLLSQVESAEYAIEIINSGLNLTQACLNFEDPLNWPGLQDVGIIPSNVADIVCWASVYGIDLNTTNAALLNEFAEAIYAIELASNYTSTPDTDVLCNSINLSAFPDLGIDTATIYSYVCNAQNITTVVSSTTTTTVTVVPGTASGVLSGSLTTVTWGSYGNATGPQASGVGFTTSEPTRTSDWTGQGNATQPWATGFTGTAATGNGNGFGNATQAFATGATGDSDPIKISFPHATSNDANHVPPNPSEQAYYPAVTSDTSSAAYAGY